MTDAPLPKDHHDWTKRDDVVVPTQMAIAVFSVGDVVRIVQERSSAELEDQLIEVQREHLPALIQALQLELLPEGRA